MMRSVTGRLYAVISVMFVALIATNIQTISFSHMVSTSLSEVAHESIDGLRAVDEFDELLDRHRHVLTTAAEHHGDAIQAAADQLTVVEREFAESPALTGEDGAPDAVLAAKIKRHVDILTSMSRQGLNAIAVAKDEAEAARVPEAYVAYTNEVEEDVSAWKTEMREAAAAAITSLGSRASIMSTVALAITVGACLVGLAAVLFGRAVLGRLHRLATAMLSLAAGNIAAEVPFCGDRDEIGLLANALKVFQEQAGQAMASEANLNAVFENMVEGIALFSADGRIVLHNQKYVHMLGLPRSDCKGMLADEIFQHLASRCNCSDGVIQDLAERIASTRARKGTDTFEINLPDYGSFTITAAVLPDSKFFVSIEDISERRASAARIQYLAHHDTLTDLPNRVLFQESLSPAVADAVGENGIGVTLLLCDLDHFKEVNDTYGHPAGDELLRQAATRMRETMRKTDVLARLGGDEFAVIHLSGPEPQEARALAERLITTLNKPFEIEGNIVSIGVSIGIARAPIDAVSPTDLMKHADLALYAAKQGGRNMFVVYDAGMAENLEERRAIEVEIRKAMDAEQFHLHYQPQVDLRTRRVIGFEALARWNHPTRGAIPPSVFIPIAEESHLINKLGEWVLRKACADAASWGGDTTISA